MARKYLQFTSHARLLKIAFVCTGCLFANIPVSAAQWEVMSTAAVPFYEAVIQQNGMAVSKPYLDVTALSEAHRPYLIDYWLYEARRATNVLTLRYGWREVEVEGSLTKKKKRGFNHLQIDAPPLFRVASKRLSYRPVPNWLLQISRKRVSWLDQMNPDNGVRRTTVSATYSRSFPGSLWETVLAYGRSAKKANGSAANSYLIESLWRIDNVHTVLGRLERAAADELFSEREALYGQTFNASKLTLGYVHDFKTASGIQFGIGGLASKQFIPHDQKVMFGTNRVSYEVFVRLVLPYR